MFVDSSTTISNGIRNIYCNKYSRNRYWENPLTTLSYSRLRPRFCFRQSYFILRLSFFTYSNIFSFASRRNTALSSATQLTTTPEFFGNWRTEMSSWERSVHTRFPGFLCLPYYVRDTV